MDGVVYLLPPAGARLAAGDAEVSSLGTPLVTTEPASRHIVLQGLTLEGTRGDLVWLYGEDHRIEGCRLRNAGGNALLVGGARHAVSGSLFSGLGGGGIAAVGQHMAQLADGITIADNDISDVGRLVHNNSGAIHLSGVGGHVVAHNTVHDIPWDGVVVLSRRCVVERNEFVRTQREGGDNGTVYSFELTDSALLVRHNVFRDIRSSWPPGDGDGTFAQGVYLDSDAGSGGNTGATVTGNVFYRVGSGAGRRVGVDANIAILNKGSGHRFTDNLVVRSDLAYHASRGGTATVEDNQWWSNAGPVPRGFTSESPRFLDEPAGSLANRPDGTLVLARGATIPLPAIGRRRPRAGPTTLTEAPP
jgi:hypothetical protein